MTGTGKIVKQPVHYSGRLMSRAVHASDEDEADDVLKPSRSWKTHGPPADGLHALLLAAGISPSDKGHGQICAQQLELGSGSEGGQRGQQASSLPARLSMLGEVEDAGDKTMEGTSYAPSLFAAAASGR
jgi:hypothetical protein